MLLPRLSLALLIVSIGCGRETDVDDVPVGADVQVTRDDGALVEGKLVERDAEAVRVDTGPVTRSIERARIADVQVPDRTAAEPPPIPEQARFREVAVPAETPLKLRLKTGAGSATSTVEDPVEAELAEAVVISGVTALPAGSPVRGHVTAVEAPGKVKGRASLSVRFDSISIAGERYPIDARFARTAESTKTRDAERIAVPAAVGAIVGAAIGEGKGAAIGAAVGGGAGAAVVMSTTGPQIALGTGTVLELQAGRALDVRVPIERE
jgi:hypothetical protein